MDDFGLVGGVGLTTIEVTKRAGAPVALVLEGHITDFVVVQQSTESGDPGRGQSLLQRDQQLGSQAVITPLIRDRQSTDPRSFVVQQAARRADDMSVDLGHDRWRACVHRRDDFRDGEHWLLTVHSAVVPDPDGTIEVGVNHVANYPTIHTEGYLQPARRCWVVSVTAARPLHTTLGNSLHIGSSSWRP